MAFVSQSLSSAFVHILYEIIIKDSSDLILQKNDETWQYIHLFQCFEVCKTLWIGRHYQISNIPFFPLSSEITEIVPELRQVGIKTQVCYCKRSIVEHALGLIPFSNFPVKHLPPRFILAHLGTGRGAEGRAVNSQGHLETWCSQELILAIPFPIPSFKHDSSSFGEKPAEVFH